MLSLAGAEIVFIAWVILPVNDMIFDDAIYGDRPYVFYYAAIRFTAKPRRRGEIVIGEGQF